MKTYRVFLTRHYIATEWYDVVADCPARARQKAVEVVNRERPDSRNEATDNGWQPSPVVPTVATPGTWAHGVFPVVEISKGVFRHAHISQR